MLTAADTTDDLVDGLALGADDYLPKPFHWPELVARAAPSCVMSTAIPSRRSPRAIALARRRSSSAIRIRISEQDDATMLNRG